MSESSVAPEPDDEAVPAASMWDCDLCQANWPIKCEDHVIEVW